MKKTQKHIQNDVGYHLCCRAMELMGRIIIINLKDKNKLNQNIIINYKNHK